MVEPAPWKHALAARRQNQTLSDFVELEEMPLSGGFHQPLPPGTKDIAAVKFELATQLIDGLLVFLDGLIVEHRRLIERGVEVLDLLSEPVQQVVTCRQDRWAMTRE